MKPRHARLAFRVLVMGRAETARTVFAGMVAIALAKLVSERPVIIQSDKVRDDYKDRDVSLEGQVRQSMRLRYLCDAATTRFVVCDFEAARIAMRENIDPFFLVWVDIPPPEYNKRVELPFDIPAVVDYTVGRSNWDAEAKEIAKAIIKKSQP